jgi:hypothetical protein
VRCARRLAPAECRSRCFEILHILINRAFGCLEKTRYKRIHQQGENLNSMLSGESILNVAIPCKLPNGFGEWRSSARIFVICRDHGAPFHFVMQRLSLSLTPAS